MIKERHAREALSVIDAIDSLKACRSIVETSVWTICQIGKDGEHQFATAVIGGAEQLMNSIARNALLADIDAGIQNKQAHLRELGVEPDVPLELPAPKLQATEPATENKQAA